MTPTHRSLALLLLSLAFAGCNCGTTAAETTSTSGSTGVASSSAASSGPSTASAAASSTAASSSGSSAGVSASAAASSTTSASAVASASAAGTGTGTATGTGAGTGTAAASSTGGSTSGSSTGGPACAVKAYATMYIDGYAGVDSPCCGAATTSACQSITQAMANIEAYEDSANILQAYMSNNAPDWTGPETWPVVLHLGVTLNAPGIYFSNKSGTPVDLFHVSINRQSPLGDDYGQVTLQGTPTAPVNIGYDSQGNDTGTQVAVAVITSSSLILQDANLAGATGLALGAADAGPAVGPTTGGRVLLGPDPVHIGGLDAGMTGTVGITCQGTAATGSTLGQNDTGTLPTTPVLFIAGETTDIAVNAGCNIDFGFGGMILGPFLDAGACPGTIDQNGIVVEPGGEVQASHVGIQCQAGDGVFVDGGPDGGPILVEFAASSFLDNGCAGMHVMNAQQALISEAEGPSSVIGNHYGVKVEGGYFYTVGAVTLACNDNNSAGNCAGEGPGIDLWQGSTVGANVNGVTWDQTTPGVYQCGLGLTGCSWGASPPAIADIVVVGPDAGVPGAESPNTPAATCE